MLIFDRFKHSKEASRIRIVFVVQIVLDRRDPSDHLPVAVTHPQFTRGVLIKRMPTRIDLHSRQAVKRPNVRRIIAVQSLGNGEEICQLLFCFDQFNSKC